VTEPYWVPLNAAPVDYKGDYAAATPYVPGDVVRYLGVDYLAVNPSQGSTPPAVTPTGLIGAKARRNTAFTMQNAAWHVLPFDAEEFDTDAIHDLSTNPHRLTCKTAGIYQWAAWLGYTLGAITWGTTFVSFIVKKNTDAIAGGTQHGGVFVPIIAGIGPTLMASGIVPLAPGDWITTLQFHNATGTCQLMVDSYFAMWRIGATP
jgi:hypothetical protein